MSLRLTLAPFASFGLAGPSARAHESDVWNCSSELLWSNSLNWNPNGIPNATGDSATFNNYFGTVSISTGITVGQIGFNNTTASTVLALSGGSLTLDNGAGTNSVISTS